MSVIRVKRFRIKSYKKSIKPLLVMKDVTKSYGSQPVLDKINMQVMPASIVGLLGPNGSGKSTIFNLLMGIIKVDSGKIIYNNKEIQNEPVTLRSKYSYCLFCIDSYAKNEKDAKCPMSGEPIFSKTVPKLKINKPL